MVASGKMGSHSSGTCRALERRFSANAALRLVRFAQILFASVRLIRLVYASIRFLGFDFMIMKHL